MQTGEPFWIVVAGGVQSVAQTIALIGGALWAFYRFGLRREGETALEIDLNYTVVLVKSATQLVSFDVSLANKSAVKLTARRRRNPAYTDKWEKLTYGIELLIRQIDSANLPARTVVAWFPTPESKSPADGDLEIDLANEYVKLEDSNEAKRLEVTDFWLEPGEVYHMTSVITLPPGQYLAMVTFLGERGDDEFWRRTFLVNLPGTRTLGEPSGK